ncbi:hypothetical protein COO60DRAFT_1122569 [Scenedesmus sp. NREL 46B-D3]|nr:hypothetical protein COO60DRAFT_1122569 [Scenedesmus sp. NREL 46B-D3]
MVCRECVVLGALAPPFKLAGGAAPANAVRVWSAGYVTCAVTASHRTVAAPACLCSVTMPCLWRHLTLKIWHLVAVCTQHGCKLHSSACGQTACLYRGLSAMTQCYFWLCVQQHQCCFCAAEFCVYGLRSHASAAAVVRRLQQFAGACMSTNRRKVRLCSSAGFISAPDWSFAWRFCYRRAWSACHIWLLRVLVLLVHVLLWHQHRDVGCLSKQQEHAAFFLVNQASFVGGRWQGRATVLLGGGKAGLHYTSNAPFLCGWALCLWWLFQARVRS